MTGSAIERAAASPAGSVLVAGLPCSRPISYHVIQDIYKNPFRVATTDTVNRLTQALGVPATELFEDVEPGDKQEP